MPAGVEIYKEADDARTGESPWSHARSLIARLNRDRAES